MPNIDIRFQRLGIFNHMWLMAVNKTGFNQTKWLTAVITANNQLVPTITSVMQTKWLMAVGITTSFSTIILFNLGHTCMYFYDVG